MIRLATAQRQNAKPIGGTASWTARPMMKLPDQNSAANTSST